MLGGSRGIFSWLQFASKSETLELLYALLAFCYLVVNQVFLWIATPTVNVWQIHTVIYGPLLMKNHHRQSAVWLVNTSKSLFLLLNLALVLNPSCFLLSLSLYLYLSPSLPPLFLALATHLHLSFSFRRFPPMPCFSPRFFVNPLPHTLYLHDSFALSPSLWLSSQSLPPSLHPPPLCPSLKHILFSPSLLHLHRHPFLLKDNLQLSGQHFALSRSHLSDHPIISGFSAEPPHRGRVDGSESPEWKS